MMTAGYSGTPLAKKLGIKAGTRVVLSGAPGYYRDLLAPLPAGVEFGSRVTATTDIFHTFVKERARLAGALASVLGKLRPDAAIWVSWPKKASKVRSDITEDGIREVALPLGLVDVKVCAIDDVWSGLKLVVRKKNRAGGESEVG